MTRVFPASPLPERIGAYRVLRCLSSTGGVDVYLGREDGPLGFSRDVLLKVAPREAGEADELLREASAVAQLNHPAIQRMFAFFEHDGRVVLVLERLEGTTLARITGAARRRKQRIAESSAFHVAYRLFGALAHAHDATGRQPVIHRAIHPGNVAIGWDGTTRLTGFGMSKIVGRSPDTAIGLVKGVDGYMAPEQVRGERITERVDVYQAGLVVWELFSGEPVPGSPQQTREMELVHMMAGERLPSFGDLRAAIPREVVAVLDAALEPDADKRGITAKEIERWLEKSVDVEGGREPLRERAIALRTAARSETGGGASGSGQYAARSTTSPRFPGVATRVTGRVGRDEAPPSERPPPPSTDAPPVSRSAYPPRPGKVPTLRPGAPPTAVPGRPPVPKTSSAKKTIAGLAPIKPLPTIEPAAPFVPPPPPAFSAPPPDAAPPSYVGPLPSAPLAPPEFTGPPVTVPVAPPSPAPTAVPAPRAPLPSVTATRPRRVALIAIVASIVSVLALGLAVLALRRPDAKPEPPAPARVDPPTPTRVDPPTPPTPPAKPETPPQSAPSPPEPAPSARPLLAIGPREGAIVVTSTAEGTVYANGKAIGALGATLIVPCGRKYLRVGQPGAQVVWTSKGVSAVATCGTTTQVELPALPTPPGRR